MLTQKVLDAYSFLIRKKNIDGIYIENIRYVKREHEGKKVLFAYDENWNKMIYERLIF